jgi:hypothetical protein
MKTCSQCLEIKPIKDFPKRKGSGDGYRADCRKCYNTKRKESSCYLSVLNSNRSRYQIRKHLVFQLLGNKCVGCGETDARVLDLDHVENDGNKRRKEQKGTSPYYVHRDILQNKNQKAYQLLCRNCNWKKRLVNDS